MFVRAIAAIAMVVLTAGAAAASDETRFLAKLRGLVIDTVSPFNPKVMCVCKESSKLARAGGLYQPAPGYLGCAIPVFAADGTAYATLDCFDYDIVNK